MSFKSINLYFSNSHKNQDVLKLQYNFDASKTILFIRFVQIQIYKCHKTEDNSFVENWRKRYENVEK